MEHLEHIDGESASESLPGMPATVPATPEELEAFQDMPLRAQQIAALLASGFTAADIERGFNLPDGTARQYKRHYLTKRGITLSPRTRDAIIAAYLRGRALGLVSAITPDKISKATLGDLTKGANILLHRAQALESPDTGDDIASQISAALSKLSAPKQLTSN